MCVSLISSVAWGAVYKLGASNAPLSPEPGIDLAVDLSRAELARRLLRVDSAPPRTHENATPIEAPPDPRDFRDRGAAGPLGPAWPASGTIMPRDWFPLQILDPAQGAYWNVAAVEQYGSPVEFGYVSSRFGNRRDPFTGRIAMHKGIDFAARAGTRIRAIAAGVVIWSGFRGGYGHIVEVDHGDGLITRYAHNAENLVGFGDMVTRGQTIARLGDTGRATGPNLHFEVLHAGQAVDPRSYLN
jgi:murein DD-endopeptidase MepM/ murein hydrolase activator NlpD